MPNSTYDLTTLKGFWKELLKRIQEIDVAGLGAQLAFFFLLSLFPLLLFTVTLLPYLNLSEEQIFTFMEEYAPAHVYTLVQNILNEILANQNGGLLSFGILATIWAASLGVNALIQSLNRSYQVNESRPFFVSRGLSILVTLLLIFIIIMALVLPVFGEQFGIFIFSFFGLEKGFLTVWHAVRFTIPPLILFTVFSIVYWAAPNTKLHFGSVFPGALFSAAGWYIVSIGFSFYVNNIANFSATYGSIGGIIVLMLWLYISAMLLMIGGQINAVMLSRRRKLKAQKEQ